LHAAKKRLMSFSFLHGQPLHSAESPYKKHPERAKQLSNIRFYMEKSKKICIGLSGGVDSSVAALLLKQAGYDVFALFMQNWHDASTTLHGDCEWEEDRFVAEMVARKIGIPFYFVDLSREYRKRVVDYMFDEYSKGRTPNPDVLCNREIKFDAFLKAARSLGADMVATGHYCRKEQVLDADGTPVYGDDGQPVYRLLAGTDPNKDQSYFLCQLTQEQLSQALFPIGDIEKPEVRRIAHEADLPSADKKDSQGICFVGKVDLPTFLQQQLKPCEGDVVEVYDAYYTENGQYNYIKGILSELAGKECNLITDYISDERSAAAIRAADAAEKPEETARYDAAEETNEATAKRLKEVAERTVAAVDSLKVNDPIRERSVKGNPENEGGCSCGSPWDAEKLAALDDGQLLRLSQPVEYDIRFETETYRSGKKHIKKTRYRENPYGKIVGKHDGAQFYTIGQRKGLNIGGHKDSVFVIATDIQKNIIYVGESHTHKGLSRSCLRIAPEEIHWIRTDLAMPVGETRRYRVRIRYRQPLQDATLIMRSNGLYILFDNPQRGITPGQFAVWYDNDEMIGSGVI
jgi:tRNA (5-methylaminomethyl-2-thiouridylate)-methyltransferase